MLKKFSLGFLLAFAMIARAGEPWLLVSPDISCDHNRACFLGEQWAGYYVAEANVLITVPRDSLNLPPPILPSNFVFFDGTLYGCEGSSLSVTPSQGARGARNLNPPSQQALETLANASQLAVAEIKTPQETMGPIIASKNRLWFGLKLTEKDHEGFAAGLGWYDITTQQFGRVYHPTLSNLSPQWIGIANDTIRALFSRKNDQGEIAASKLISFAAQSTSLALLDPLALGVPGKVIINSELWGDTLLISTDEAVAIWKPNGLLQAWGTFGYSARSKKEVTWTYLRTFSEKGLANSQIDTVRFQALLPGKPAMVKAQIGDWLEVVPTEGIEGYVSVKDWADNNSMWEKPNWSCSQKPCFARVKVPMHGDMVETDFTNTPLSYLSQDEKGVKIGFLAGWALKDDLYPAYIPIRPPEKKTNNPPPSTTKR